MHMRFRPKRRALPCFTLAAGGLLLAVAQGPIVPLHAEAAEWSAAYVRTLLDDAFAAIETAADGRRLRHLPHHDHTGALDLPHLRSALARWHQVKWGNPAAAAAARAHLEAHRDGVQSSQH